MARGVTGAYSHAGERVLVFNSPLETGVRAVILLTACYPKAITLDELVALDHLVVHTEDVGGPPSLHPAEETRAAELLVRRDVLRDGLRLMGLKGLVQQHATDSGFRYVAGAEAGNFVDLLSTRYSTGLIQRAGWLVENVLSSDDDALERLAYERLQSVLLTGASALDEGA